MPQRVARTQRKDASRSSLVPKTFDDLDTPSLVVDLDRVDRNIARMAALAAQHSVALRPHVKSHKVPELARWQVSAGASGITCQRLSEAEVMVGAGLNDVLIATEIVGVIKATRLAELASRARLTTVIDSIEGARQVGAAVASRGLVIDALVEVDLGLHRCGVQPPQVGELAEQVSRIPGLQFVGIMGYEGHVYDKSHIRRVADTAARAYGRLDRALVSLDKAGLVAGRVSVGATAAARAACVHPGINELRCGSYIFNDLTQVAAGWAALDECAATVLATVVSARSDRSAVIDAGAKTLSLARTPGRVGYGLILGHEASVIARLSDEHGMVEGGGHPLRVGERVLIVPNSHTTVVNEFSEMVGVRNGKVEETWKVEARGCSR